MSVRSVVFDIIGRESVSPAANRAAASMEGAAARISRAGERMSVAGRTLTRNVTLPVLAIGAASIKMAVDFNSSMTKIQTQAGGSARDVKLLSDQVLALAKYAEQGPTELADSLYHLKSVGMDNVDAMQALRQASDLAAVGGAKLEDTTNALAGAWRTGIAGAKDFHQAVSTINAVIGAGNMKMEDLNAALGTGILPTAKTFGLTLKDVGAALAVFTDEGVPADAAATRLRMSMSLLGAPSAAAEAQLKSIGLTGLNLANDMRKPNGLIAAIGDLKSHLEDPHFHLSLSQQAQLLSHAFGGGRSSSAILSLINNFDVLKKKQDQVTASMHKYNEAVAAQRQTPQAQFKLLESSLQRSAILIGQDVLPVVLKMAHGLGDLLEGFNKLTDGQRKFIVEAALAAAALGPLLTLGSKLIRMFSLMWRAMTFPSRVLYGWGAANKTITATGEATGRAAASADLAATATTRAGRAQLAQAAAAKEAAALTAVSEASKAAAAARTATAMEESAFRAGGAEAVMAARAATDARAFAAAKQLEADAAVKSAATILAASTKVGIATAEEAAAARTASRARMGGVAMGAGFGLMLAGSQVGGKTGQTMSNVGTAAMVGSMVGPEGAVVAGGLALGASTMSIGPSHGMVEFAKATQMADATVRGLSDTLGKAVASSDAFHQAMTQMRDTGDASGFKDIQAVDKIVQQLPAGLQGTALGWDKYKAAFDKALNGDPSLLRQMTHSLLANRNATEANVPTMKDLANVTDLAGHKIQSLSDAITNLDHGMVGLANSTLAFKLGLKDLPGQLHKHNKAITGDTKAALENRQALVGLIGQIKEHASAMDAAGKKAPVVAKAIDTDVDALRAVAKHAGISSKAFDNLIKHMHLTPKQVHTDVIADTTSATSKLTSLQDQLNAIANGSYVAHVTASGNINITGAAGGPIYAGHIATGTGAGVLPQGWAWVGDPGPNSELTHTTRRGTQVFSAPESRRVAAGMGIPVPSYATGTGTDTSSRDRHLKVKGGTLKLDVGGGRTFDAVVQDIVLAELDY